MNEATKPTIRKEIDSTANLDVTTKSDEELAAMPEEARRLYEENRDAIDYYNAFIEKHGLFTDNLPDWKR